MFNVDERYLAAELADPPLTLCPKCAGAWVLPDTPAGRLGVCPSCWNRALAEAHRLAAEELEAVRENDAARAAKSRAARRAKRAK